MCGLFTFAKILLEVTLRIISITATAFPFSITATAFLVDPIWLNNGVHGGLVGLENSRRESNLIILESPICSICGQLGRGPEVTDATHSKAVGISQIPTNGIIQKSS